MRRWQSSMSIFVADDDSPEKLDTVTVGLLDEKVRIALRMPDKFVGHSPSKAILGCKNVCFT